LTKKTKLILDPILKRILSCVHIDAYSKDGLISLQGVDEDDQKLLAKLVKHPKKGWQIELVFLGESRLEKQHRYEIEPKEWVTWGEIVFSIDQIRKLQDFLDQCIARIQAEQNRGSKKEIKEIAEALI